jgi:thioredoxin 1
MKKNVNSIVMFAIFTIFFAFMVLSPDFVSAVPPKANLVPSDYDTGITWKQAIKSKKPIAVNFYVDWCGYCKRFAPILDGVRQEYKSKYDFVLINAENPKNQKLVQDFAIQGYPSFFLVEPRTHLHQLVNQSYYNNPPALRTELDKFLKNINAK